MKQWITTILALITTITAFAQKPKEKALLWKIEGHNITAPSYLFGTFHLLCPEDFHIPDTLKFLLAQTKELYLEIDIDDPKLTLKMMQQIKMKDGKTLKNFLTKEEYDSAAILFKNKTGVIYTYKRKTLLIKILFWVVERS